jgi:hypothetical protein
MYAWHTLAQYFFLATKQWPPRANRALSLVEFFEHIDSKPPEPKNLFSGPEKQCSVQQALNLGVCSAEQGSARSRFEHPAIPWQMQKVLLKD